MSLILGVIHPVSPPMKITSPPTSERQRSRGNFDADKNNSGLPKVFALRPEMPH
jgi:hypothetical protein